MASLENHMQYMIKKQFNKRTEAKNAHHGSQKADYTHIYSRNSLNTHTRAIHKFCVWAKENQIKRIRQISHEVVGNYCLFLQNQGYSAWTIKAEITAINHVMVGTGNWDKNTVFTATKWNATHDVKTHTLIKRKNRGEIWNNRRQTAADWRIENPTLYKNNQQLIDTTRAFGLRKSEICHANLDKPSIVANSFFESQGKLYCFVPYGKGGRPRFATCRADLIDEMCKYYDFQSIGKLPHEMDHIKNFRDNFMKRNEEVYRKNGYLFNGKVSGRLRFHIQRREYAQKRLSEEFDKWGQQNTQKTINGVTGNIRAFHEVSLDLGHGRIDVLGNYIGK